VGGVWGLRSCSATSRLHRQNHHLQAHYTQLLSHHRAAEGASSSDGDDDTEKVARANERKRKLKAKKEKKMKRKKHHKEGS